MFRYMGVQNELPNITVDELWTLVPWERRGDSPRFECWFALDSRSYTYGKGRGVRTYDSHKLIPCIEEMWSIVERLTDTMYHGCFLNGYKDGTDHLGWHADDGPDIDPAEGIAVVTYTSSRPRAIWMKPKGSEDKTAVDLENRSIFFMEPGCQQHFEHRIPRAGFVCGPRISLTFRGLT